MKLDILRALNAERAARRAAVVVTDVASGEQRLVKAADVARDPLKDLIEKRIRSGKSGMEETPDGKVFLTVHVPPAQLVITGAVHISQALAPIAKLLGYDVTIVDPRTAFASIERFPDVKVIAEWPDVALPPLGIDRYTAFVALDPRPQDRRSRADPRAGARLLLYRRARLEEDPRASPRAAQGARACPTPRSRASMRRSGSTSARCRPPRSRWRSWARSRPGCESLRRRRHEVRCGAGGAGRGRRCGAFDPPERPGVEERHPDRQAGDRRPAGCRHRRDRGGADRARRRVGGRGRGRDRGGGRGRGGARRSRLHRPGQSVRRERRRAGGRQGRHRSAQPGRRVDHLRDARRPTSPWSRAR